MVETRHVKLDYEEALASKKQLLSTELSLLQTEKRVRNYKLLRKKELAFKNRLKTALGSLRTKMNQLQATFPEEETPIKFKRIKTGIEKRKQEDIRKQLKDIEEKLAGLQ